MIFKVMIGRHRPDFLSRCIPIDENNTFSLDPLYGLSNISICTQTDKKILKDGQMSFLSGHSSLSFSGLFYLSLYLGGKFGLFDRRGYVIKTLIVLAPLILALIIAISRIQDYRHHPSDVVCGSLLGILTAYFSYHQYFPSLFDPNSQYSFPTRSHLNKITNAANVKNLPQEIDQV